MTPEEMGADIFRKYNASAFADKKWALLSLAAIKKRLADRVDAGFYQAEAKANVYNEVKPTLKVKA